MRKGFPDEEPEEDETDWDQYREMQTAWKHCERCGIEGHKGKDCPTITPDLLRNLRND